MSARNYSERERDVMLIADAVTATLKAALPAMLRREVEMQLAIRADETVDLDEDPHAAATLPGAQPNRDSHARIMRKTLPGGLVRVGVPNRGRKS